MIENPLQRLHDECGQSPWYDNIRRKLLSGGELQRMIEHDGIRGVTANPTIFEKAISGSTDYEDAIQKLVGEGKSVSELYEGLVVDDIRAAADLLRPVYDKSEYADGFVSIEVSPSVAYDTEGTIAEAREFHQTIDRPNVLIKVPATDQGIPAIRQLISEGISVNVTLIFGLDYYERVMDAYLGGLEQRAAAGQPLHDVSSVASFFVSRIDTEVDKRLDAMLKETSDEQRKQLPRGLRGKAAIANAKLAYQRFQEVFAGERFLALKAKGARVQRPLWASTGTKDPAYSDVLYVDSLIGPDTVNTMPPATVDAYRDHGNPAIRVTEDIDGAREVMRQLAQAGVSLQEVTDKLQADGVKSFAKSFDDLTAVITARRAALLTGVSQRQSASLGALEGPVQQTLQRLSETDFVRKVWGRDGTVWKSKDDEAAQRSIKNRLGWLTVVDQMEEHADDLMAFARGLSEEGYQDAVLLGMGGSSLCPDVLRATLGTQPGGLRLFVLDTTDPASIDGVQQHIEPAKTLFIVASKSGATTETLSHFKHFHELVSQTAPADEVGRHFVAITDPGTPLEQLAHEHTFRRVFNNPPDIGGRYSALSYFGVVPAALLGIDLKAFLDRAQRMMNACASVIPAMENPAVWLGVIMGEAALAGRDKVTLIASPAISTYGYWAEQLIAESTGKEGKGIVPIEGETLGDPSVYGPDRLFVHLSLDSEEDRVLDRKLRALEQAGHPVVHLSLRDAMDIAGEFFRWELATATAGALLGINPFDEPNVQESKDNTKRLLGEFQQHGKLPEPAALVGEGPLAAVTSEHLPAVSVREALVAHLRQARAGDYVAIMAYIQRSDTHEMALQETRLTARDALRVATTLGYGPRFLHSTGQLHKGGAPRGLFLQITGDDVQDVTIPGQPYSFSVLKQAQALGDLQALQQHGLRVLRIHISGDLNSGLMQLANLVRDSLGVHAHA